MKRDPGDRALQLSIIAFLLPTLCGNGGLCTKALRPAGGACRCLGCGRHCTGSGFFRGCLGVGQPQRFSSSPSPARFGVRVAAGQGQLWPPLEAGVMRPTRLQQPGTFAPGSGSARLRCPTCWLGIWTRATRLGLSPDGGSCTETERERERKPRGKGNRIGADPVASGRAAEDLPCGLRTSPPCHYIPVRGPPTRPRPCVPLPGDVRVGPQLRPPGWT